MSVKQVESLPQDVLALEGDVDYFRVGCIACDHSFCVEVKTDRDAIITKGTITDADVPYFEVSRDAMDWGRFATCDSPNPCVNQARVESVRRELDQLFNIG